jgi:hypothetical protein
MAREARRAETGEIAYRQSAYAADMNLAHVIGPPTGRWMSFGTGIPFEQWPFRRRHDWNGRSLDPAVAASSASA